MPIPILPAFYFGSVEHYRLLAQQEKVIIDTGEHYLRQSYRTRTSIVGPNGKQDLVVHIEHGQGRKMPMRDVRLCYDETWPQQHLHAIRSAYGKAPWAIHYIDEIELLLLARYERLVDLDLATMRLCMKWLGLKTEVEESENYVEVVGPLVVGRGSDLRTDSRLTTHDFRTSLHPKQPLPQAVATVAPYPQVFADRHGFIPRMSIIDLVCNTGPRAKDHLLS